MLYFRRIWFKFILLLTMLIVVSKLVLVPLSKVIMWVANQPLIVAAGKLNGLVVVSGKVSKLANDLVAIAIALLILTGMLLTVWLIIDVINGQLKLDYYSIQLGKHLQRSTGNTLQMMKIEQDKANYWLKRLRIIHWKHRLYVLIPCGPSAAVEEIVKDRCDNYIIGWLNLTIKNTNWINKITEYNRAHFNWLIVKEK